jgi:hypothetical protein
MVSALLKLRTFVQTLKIWPHHSPTSKDRIGKERTGALCPGSSFSAAHLDKYPQRINLLSTQCSRDCDHCQRFA